MSRQRVIIIIPLAPSPATLAFAQDLKRRLEGPSSPPAPKQATMYSARIQLGDLDPDDEEHTPVDDPRSPPPIEMIISLN